MERCAICGRHFPDKHHIKTRGSGGTDDWWNLISLCRIHHTEVHAIGNLKMSEKYPKFLSEITARGWSFNHLNKLSRLSNCD